MRRLLVLGALIGALAVTGCGSSDDDGGGSTGDGGGPVEVTFWHGQNDVQKRAYDTLVAEFNETHPDIRVDSSSGGVLADEMLTKITAGLAGGAYPDVAYLFGSDLANVARSDKVQNLTEAVRDPAWRWDDFWAGEREGTMVDGQVRAVPALADNLTIIYNRRLLADAGIEEPTRDWTWEDYRAVAKATTDEGTGTFGTSWPGAGGEDTTWRFWPPLWQQGGEILSDDGKQAAFDSPAGVRALQLLGDMATEDKSIYVDPDPNGERAIQLFQNGKIAMLMGGSWLLPDLIEARIDYGVVGLPGWDGDHTTVSGSDNWVLFDNGDERARAVQEFARWLTDARQDLKLIEMTQQLPLRESTSKTPAYRALAARIPGTELFAMDLATARSRPALQAYPELSRAVGEAIVSVLLGRADAEEALEAAAQRANGALAAGG